MRVAGTRVLITGAGRGLGLAIAVAFARAKANVVITDLNAERVQKAVAELAQFGDACGYPLDVTIPAQIAEVHSRVMAEHGPIDILVNNAGVVFGGSFLDVSLDRHLATVAVNLSGLIAMTHALLPGLITRPAAHVVNIASASAVVAFPMATTYAASKWAVLGFSESLREELHVLGHSHVGISAICPAFIRTGLFNGAKPSRLTDWLSAEEVAKAVVRAVETNREFVMLPWRARLMYRLCAGWPRSWYRAVCRWLGVSHSMVNWHGHRD